MKSLVIKRSIVIGGHKTSVSLEDAFWSELKDIAGRRDMTISTMVGEIDTQRSQGNLSSAIRLFVLDSTRNRANEKMIHQPMNAMLAGAEMHAHE